MLSRKDFEDIRGFNPLYRGWGNEDEDLRERLQYYGKVVKRQESGTFYCLYHKDNGNIAELPKQAREAFTEGRHIYTRWFEYLQVGYPEVKYTYLKDTVEEPGWDNVFWIKSTNYRIDL